MIKFYVDEQNNYIGSFDGETGKIPANAIEVPSAPDDARQKWQVNKWGPKPVIATQETENDRLYAALKVALPAVFTDAKIDIIKGG